MPVFPVAKLQPLDATLSGEPDEAELQIPLVPFELDDLSVETEIVCDCIELPTLDLAALSQQSFDFPTNPDDGCIDASVYIEHAHHPVDITSIAFGPFENGKLHAQLDLTILFSHEGLRDFEDVQCTLPISIVDE